MQIPRSAVDCVRTAKHIMVVTGAGTSAESGVPTFREAQTGLWAQYDPMELATPEAFLRNPKLVWEWYVWRRENALSAKPNSGHFALVRLAELVPRFTLVTQNVDGLHQRAGSTGVIELHGSLMRARCFENDHFADPWPPCVAENPPRCVRCGGLMRPDVVWFHEVLPTSAITAAERAATDCDVFLSVGTSSVVYPAAGLGQHAAGRGATVIEINPADTPLTEHATFVLQGPSGEMLPALVDAD